MKLLPLLLVPFLFLTSAPDTGAVTIADNGGPDQVNGFRSDSDFAPGPRQVGDDFTLAATATAGQIQWWGVYSPNNTPTAPDDFTIRFFTITAGVPSPIPLFSYPIGDVGRVDSGLNIGLTLFDIYSFTATIPDTTLLAGSYLLSVVNNTASDTNDSWLWATSGSGTGSQVRVNEGDPWISLAGQGNPEFAFNISSPNPPAVPDSGTSALLLGLSLGALFLVQRRPELPRG